MNVNRMKHINEMYGNMLNVVCVFFSPERFSSANLLWFVLLTQSLIGYDQVGLNQAELFYFLLLNPSFPESNPFPYSLLNSETKKALISQDWRQMGLPALIQHPHPSNAMHCTSLITFPSQSPLHTAPLLSDLCFCLALFLFFCSLCACCCLLCPRSHPLSSLPSVPSVTSSRSLLSSCGSLVSRMMQERGVKVLLP